MQTKDPAQLTLFDLEAFFVPHELKSGTAKNKSKVEWAGEVLRKNTIALHQDVTELKSIEEDLIDLDHVK